MRTLGFVGATRLAAANRLLPEAIRQWLKQWCFQNNAELICSCQEESIATPALKADAEWKLSSTAEGSLWIAANWQRLVFGRYAADAPQDRMGQQLLAATQEALASSLLDVLGQKADTSPSDESPSSLGALLNARLLLDADVGQEKLLVLVDAGLLANFLPRAARHLPLVDRRAAIGGAKLQLKVSLPFANLSVAEVNDLQAGDILQANTHFLEPLNLTVRDKHTVAKGFLARRDQHLALQLTTHE